MQFIWGFLHQGRTVRHKQKTRKIPLRLFHRVIHDSPHRCLHNGAEFEGLLDGEQRKGDRRGSCDVGELYAFSKRSVKLVCVARGMSTFLVDDVECFVAGEAPWWCVQDIANWCWSMCDAFQHAKTLS